VRQSVIGGVGVAAALALFIGSGTANAVNEYKGMTYEKAASQINAGGGTVVIATRDGSYLPTEKCIVTASRKAKALDGSGRSQGVRFLLDLNCNATSAQSGHPGNSLATPEGVKAKQMRDLADAYSVDYAKAVAAGKNPSCANKVKWCQRVCTTSDACSAELSQYLGL